MAETRRWVPPTLCGCEFNITAEWPEAAINGVTYRHPRPHVQDKNTLEVTWTVSDIQITSVCATHEPFVSWDIDDSLFLDRREQTSGLDPGENGTRYTGPAEASFPNFNPDSEELWQPRGYLRVPVESPTKAQRLYIYLQRFNSAALNLSCGCKVHVCSVDEDSRSVPTEVSLSEHPALTRRCRAHRADDDHQQAIADSIFRDAVEKKILSAYPELARKTGQYELDSVTGAPVWTVAVVGIAADIALDKDRSLRINVANYKKSAELQAALDSEYGAGSVIVRTSKV